MLLILLLLQNVLRNIHARDSTDTPISATSVSHFWRCFALLLETTGTASWRSGIVLLSLSLSLSVCLSLSVSLSLALSLSCFLYFLSFFHSRPLLTLSTSFDSSYFQTPFPDSRTLFLLCKTQRQCAPCESKIEITGHFVVARAFAKRRPIFKILLPERLSVNM